MNTKNLTEALYKVKRWYSLTREKELRFELYDKYTIYGCISSGDYRIRISLINNSVSELINGTNWTISGRFWQ